MNKYLRFLPFRSLALTGLCLIFVTQWVPTLAAAGSPDQPTGSVHLEYDGESLKIEEFREMGTNLLFSAGTVSLSLVVPGGDKISIGFLARDGAPETGVFAPLTPGKEQEKRTIQLSTLGIIGPKPGLRLASGSVTVSQCNRDGTFVAEFSGEAASINPTVEGLKPFSGKIDVKVPVIER